MSTYSPEFQSKLLSKLAALQKAVDASGTLTHITEARLREANTAYQGFVETIREAQIGSPAPTSPVAGPPQCSLCQSSDAAVYLTIAPASGGDRAELCPRCAHDCGIDRAADVTPDQIRHILEAAVNARKGRIE